MASASIWPPKHRINASRLAYPKTLGNPLDSTTPECALNCSFLLAVRSELLEEAPQIVGVLLVLNPRKHHFGARNLRLGIFDVFLEGPFVPDDPGIFIRIRVIVA